MRRPRIGLRSTDSRTAPRRPCGRVQAWVERERLLKIEGIETGGPYRLENQVPAMGRYCARNRHEAMATKKAVAKGLLARARRPRPQPVGIRRVFAFNDMNLRNIGGPRRRKHVRRCVERSEPCMDRNFQDGDRRIESAVDGADALAVPAAPIEERPLAAIPVFPRTSRPRDARRQGCRRRRAPLEGRSCIDAVLDPSEVAVALFNEHSDINRDLRNNSFELALCGVVPPGERVANSMVGGDADEDRKAVLLFRLRAALLRRLDAEWKETALEKISATHRLCLPA